VGAFALFGVFGGLGGLDDWLDMHPEALEALYAPVREGPWFTFMVLAFAAGFLLPRQFHMIFVENMEPARLKTAAWAFPAVPAAAQPAHPPDPVGRNRNRWSTGGLFRARARGRARLAAGSR
jgi:Na+/proline symporter